MKLYTILKYKDRNDGIKDKDQQKDENTPVMSP